MKPGCRSSHRGDYFIKQQRILLSIRGSLCCAYIKLIITLQSQYNAVGERRFWRKNPTETKQTQQTSPSLSTRQSPRKSDFTVCQSQNPVARCYNWKMSWSVSAWKKESLEKHSFYRLCFPTGVRGSWWWFCCRRKQLWAPAQSSCCRDRSDLGTQSRCAHARKALQNTSDTSLQALIATTCASLQWNFLPELGFGRDTRGNRSQTLHYAPGNGCEDASLDFRDTHSVPEKSHQWV